MKKQFTILLIFVFTFSLIPINTSKAITQTQINATVELACSNDGLNWSLGSGTLIDSKGIILTNRHVTEVNNGMVKYCLVGLTKLINKAPTFDYIAEVKYWSSEYDNTLDVALLYIDNKNNEVFPFISVWSSNSDSLSFGDKLEVIGYPGVGGSTITYTSGDFSGFGNLEDETKNYIKSTAILEHGNSGGGAYDPRGNYIGIPSQVVKGSLNSISYLLSVNSIKKWMSGLLGSDYNNEIKQTKPVVEQETYSILNYTPNFDPIDLSKYALRVYPIENDAVSWNKQLDLDKPQPYSDIFYELIGVPEIFSDYYSNNNHIAYYTETSDNIFDFGYPNPLYATKNPSALFKDPNLSSNTVVVYGVASLREEGSYYIKFKNVKNGIPGQVYSYENWLKSNSHSSSFELTPYLQSIESKIYNWGYVYSKSQEQKGEKILNTPVDMKLAKQLKGRLLLQVEQGGAIWYVDTKEYKRYSVTFTNALPLFRKLSLGISDVDLTKIPIAGSGSIGSTSLRNRLKGKLLLQVQQGGNIWYVDFNGYRHSVTWNNLLPLFQSLSLGITNADLSKISVGSLE